MLLSDFGALFSKRVKFYTLFNKLLLITDVTRALRRINGCSEFGKLYFIDF
jgi:hypothetical protein